MTREPHEAYMTTDLIDGERDEEGLYPMRVVARLTGLSADTIRAWERRYGAVRPSRTDGRARRYSESEVRRLVLLREATERGHAIGTIGRLEDAALAAMAQKNADAPMAPVRPTMEAQVDEYLGLVERYETRRAIDMMTRTAAMLDPREFCLRFLQPTLEEIGRRWEHGESSVVHEHIVSTHVKIVLGIYARVASPDPGAPKLVFVTPEHHRHEFGIHMGAILATMRGVEPVVLGPDVPYELLDEVVARTHPAALLFGISREFEDAELTRFADVVARLGETTRVWVGCPRTLTGLEKLPDTRRFHDFETLDTALAGLRMD